MLDTPPYGRFVLDDQPPEPFFRIVADHDRGFFSVDGPMSMRRLAAVQKPRGALTPIRMGRTVCGEDGVTRKNRQLADDLCVG
jgi:hypothetical protein